MTLVAAGKWADYLVSYNWMDDIDALHFSCAFELRIPELRRREATELVARINTQLWVGHFDLWFNDDLVMFRHALLLPESLLATAEQCQAMLGMGLGQCEQHFQAFQFVVWAGKSAEESLTASLFQTEGTA